LQEFKNKTSIELILVLFVDDLDRCLDGRSMKVF
jgi:hypothetical protein